MIRLFIPLLLLAMPSAFCQTSAKDPASNEALLAEVHQLRLAIESMTGASQRVQIALYSLQLQDGAAARATQRLDAVKAKCAGVEQDRSHFTSELQRVSSLAPSNSDPEAIVLRDHLANLKNEVETRAVQSQNCQAAEAEAANQLRTEQAKLTELQDRITRLDAALAKLGSEGR